MRQARSAATAAPMGMRKELPNGGFTETRQLEAREMGPADIMKGDDVIGRVSDSEVSDEKPGVKYAVITKKSSAMCSGIRSTLNAGKIIDSLNYDLLALQKQSVRMKRFDTLVEAEEYLNSVDLG